MSVVTSLNKARVLRNLQTIFVLGQLVARREFKSWLYCNDARFSWATPDFLEGLRATAVAPFRHLAPRGQEPTELPFWERAGEQLTKYAVAGWGVLGEPPRKHALLARRTAEAHQPDSVSLHQLLSRCILRADDDVADTAAAHTLQAVKALTTYVRCRLTLQMPVNHAAFEALLMVLNKDWLQRTGAEWVLGHSAEVIRNKFEPLGHLISWKDFSFELVLDAERFEAPMAPGVQVFRYSRNGSAVPFARCKN